MKKKLIHIKQAGFLVCDNPDCSYILNEKPEDRTRESYINEPCPECGENLLTKEDYTRFNKVMKFVDFINKWLGWMGTYEDNPKNKKLLRVHIHDKITLEDISE